MDIYGLNIASSTRNPNGRGWIDPTNNKFVYLPIVEERQATSPVPSYRELGFDDVRYPNLPVHHDPEFETFTYGHVRRGFGDQRLWKLQPGDLLFFYATLDLQPSRRTWGAYVLGFFKVKCIQDTRGMTAAAIRKLPDFAANAHMKRVKPGVELLIKGETSSRLYGHAIPLSDHKDNHRLNADFTGILTTTRGKPIIGGTWHRWLLYSRDASFGKLLASHR